MLKKYFKFVANNSFQKLQLNDVKIIALHNPHYEQCLWPQSISNEKMTKYAMFGEWCHICDMSEVVGIAYSASYAQQSDLCHFVPIFLNNLLKTIFKQRLS